MAKMKVHELQGYIQSIYLVEYEHKLLLLDGCCRCDVPLIINFIKSRLKRPIEQLKLVIVTHMHPDHAGAALLLRRRTGCEIATGIFERQWYAGLTGALAQLRDIGLAYYVARKLGRAFRPLHYPRTLSPDYQLEGGAPLPGFEDWTAVEAPGHTGQDIALSHQGEGLLYAGDVILKVRDRYISPLPLHYPERYQATLDRIEALAPQRLMMAHGGAVAFEPEILKQVRATSPSQPTSTGRVIRSALRRALGLA